MVPRSLGNMTVLVQFFLMFLAKLGRGLHTNLLSKAVFAYLEAF